MQYQLPVAPVLRPCAARFVAALPSGLPSRDLRQGIHSSPLLTPVPVDFICKLGKVCHQVCRVDTSCICR